MLSTERQLLYWPAIPCPSHYVQIRGLLRSPSKSSGRDHGTMFGAQLETMLAPLPLGIELSGNTGLQLVVPVMLSPILSALQRLRKLAWQGQPSGVSFLEAAQSLLSLGGGRRNTEGMGRGSSEPQTPGTEPIARATTLKAKHSRALLQKAVFTSPAEARKGVYRPTNSSNASLCSGHGTPAGLSPTPTSTPTPNPAQQPGS